MDVPPLDRKYSISSELPKQSFTYFNPGVTTFVPAIFETKIERKIPELPSFGNRSESACYLRISVSIEAKVPFCTNSGYST